MRDYIKDFEKSNILMSNNDNDLLSACCKDAPVIISGKIVCRILTLFIENQKIATNDKLILLQNLYISPKELHFLYSESRKNKKSTLVCKRLKKRFDRLGSFPENEDVILTEIRKKEPNFLI